MRYAYVLTSALILGGAAATFAVQSPVGAQVAQNEPGTIAAAPPRAGAPMSFADLASKLQPAVVNISTTQRVEVSANPFAGTPFGDLFGNRGGGGGNGGRPITREATSLGSGFLISADGYIVTNSHVISGGGRGNAVVSSITVTMTDRREFKATVVGRDPASDLAVLKIDGRGLPFVKFGDSSRTRVGDWVVAIGQPYGLGGTVTAGIVSAIHRNIGSGPFDRYIQTDAAINQGNSGGPMFDLQGNVVGINSAIFSPTGGNVGIGFAIPAELALPIVDTLKGGARVRRGYLGVQVQPLDDGIADSLGVDKNRGELVARVEPGQPAARAGLRQGDVVVRVNNRDVSPDQTLSYIVASQPVGARVPIEIIRDGRRQTVTVTLGERPQEEQIAALQGDGGGDAMAPDDEQTAGAATRESLGLALQQLTPAISRQLGLEATTRGVVIGAVDPSSDAATKGLQRGDVILSVNSRATMTPAEVTAAAAAAKSAGRSNVLLYVQRGTGQTRYVAVKFKQG